MNKPDSARANVDFSVTRRKFLGTTALGSAALVSGGLASLLQRPASAAADFSFVEAIWSRPSTLGGSRNSSAR
jgi:hypothetical protein